MNNNVKVLETKETPAKGEKKRLTKNLLNCKPSEALAQMWKVAEIASPWLAATKIFEIKKPIPPEKFKVVPENGTEEEKRIANAYNNNVARAEVKKRLFEMLQVMLKDNAQQTLELIAVANFVEPEDIDEYDFADFLEPISEMISDQRLVNFFISAARLNNMKF